ncbi:MAG: imidazolonepropionase-like amidohydrolase [Kiritimatiellia bacterium]
MRWLVPLMFVASCAASAAPDEAEEPLTKTAALVLSGAHITGFGVADMEIRDGRVHAIGAVDPLANTKDVVGRWIVPAFIDSHVHLVFSPRGPQMLAGGIAGAVDWAAPVDKLNVPGGPAMRFAGPMITSKGGYPTQGWGRDGYGLQVSTVAEAHDAVDDLHGLGVSVIKLPLGASGGDMSDEVARAVIDRAHSHGLLVGVHALSDRSVAKAAALGADVLVHAPPSKLSDDTGAAWSSKSVVATISAFGGTESTRQLRAAGATLLYGTDFGNTQTAAISRREIEGMMAAGMDGQAIIEAGTSAPARVFQFDDLGSLHVGKEASLLVLDQDPRVNPLVLASPVAVLFRGRLVAGEL